MVWEASSAIFGGWSKIERKFGAKYLWIGVVLGSLFSDIGIITAHVSAYYNDNQDWSETLNPKMYISFRHSNSISDNSDTRKSLLNEEIRNYSNPEEEIPVIESISVSPNPSTKGDKVFLNISVAYKNLSGLKYSWSEVGNLVVSLNGADTRSPSFIAPHVRGITNVTFCVTVTNETGRTAYGNVTATIIPSNTGAKITSIGFIMNFSIIPLR